MGKIASGFEESGVKQSKLSLLFEDFLDHFDSMRNGLQTQLLELQVQENRFGVRENQLAAKANELDGINGSIKEKLNHLSSLQLLIQEHEEELSIKEKRFSDVRRQVEEKERECGVIEERVEYQTKRFGEYEEELFLKENQLSDVERSIEEKEREYVLIEKRIQNRTQKLNSCEKAVEEKSKLLEFREKEVRGVREQLDKCSQKIELKERHLNEILGSIEVQKKDLSSKEKQAEVAQRTVDECDDAIKLKKEKLSLIGKLIVERSDTLKSKERKIRAMDLKVEEFCLHKRTMEEWSCKLELKEKQFESKVEELNNRINECLNGLEMKEGQLEQQAKELELKQQQIDLIRKCSEEHTQNLECTPANMVAVSSSTSQQSSINKDGRGLQMLMNETLQRFDSLDIEVLAHLKASSDPAELVLDAMQGFYPSIAAVLDMKFDFDLRIIRRSCVLLLQELKRFSPQINPRVREEAIKQAADWKAKMTVAADNSLEIMGFLWLLAAFELTSTFSARELQSLLAIVALAQPGQATDLSQALSITDKAPGGTPYFPIKIEESESSPVGNVATSSSPNLQLSATTDPRNLQGCLEKHLSGNHSAHNEMFLALQMSQDPEKFVLKLMQKSLSEYRRQEGPKEIVMLQNISMLKELMQVLPHVGPHVKKDAVELAVQWKAKMRASSDNSFEILCFLQFITTYGLVSTFNVDEIVRLLGMISQHKQALELSQKLGFAERIPDFIRILIERKQVIEAVRHICTFKLMDKFPPALLLKQHVEDAGRSFQTRWMEKKSVDEKNKVVHDQIGDLRAVIQCIKDCNLESEYPSKDIGMLIVQLEKIKETWRQFGRQYAFEQDLGKRKKSSTSTTSAPKFQPPEKRPAIAAAGPCALPSSTSGYPQLSSASQLYASYVHPGQLGSTSRVYENFRQPAQFGMAANDREMGASSGALPLKSSPGLSGTYGHRVAANDHGADFTGTLNDTFHHSDPFSPIPHSYGPN